MAGYQVVAGNSPAWNARIDLDLVPPNGNWAPSNLIQPASN